MGNSKTIVCEACGKIAVVPSKRRINYCNNPECEKTVKKNHMRKSLKKYQAKLKKAKKAKAIKPTEEKAVVNPAMVVNTTAIDNVDIGDIRAIARELGNVRFHLIEMLQKEQELIKSREKGDLTMLHAFELENLTKEEVWDMYVKTKARRGDRRTCKYRYYLIQALLSSILVKNPDKFVVTAIQAGREKPNFVDVIEEMKANDELYVQLKGENREA